MTYILNNTSYSWNFSIGESGNRCGQFGEQKCPCSISASPYSQTAITCSYQNWQNKNISFKLLNRKFDLTLEDRDDTYFIITQERNGDALSNAIKKVGYREYAQYWKNNFKMGLVPSIK